MGSLFGRLFDFIQELWPFVVVHQWERGAYYVCGRFWREMGPGLKVVCPWFTHIEVEDVVPGTVKTSRQDVTLADAKSTLTFVVAANVCVVDLPKAINTVQRHRETAIERIECVLGEELAKARPEQLTPELRGRLLRKLLREINKETTPFGVEVSDIAFTTCVVDARMYRVLQDGGIAVW